MRIAFLNSSDPRDTRSWSGTLFQMWRSLQRHCGEVEVLGPAGQIWWLAGKVVRQSARVLLRTSIDYSHTIILSKALGRIFKRRLARQGIDVIFAPVASTEIAFLESDLPIVSYADLTAKLFNNYSAAQFGLSQWSQRQNAIIERRAIQNSSFHVYASEWAARSAISQYAIEPDKISVIPLGANFDEPPTRAEALSARERGNRNTCQLLFVGVDWERKGGNVALETKRLLCERGVNASLTVVGCTPPNAANEPNLRVFPFLDKANATHQRQLKRLFLESDFMLFPTRREAFGVVCCEANAYALPVIASDVGGVPVRNGENGILLHAEASAEDYARSIQSLLNDSCLYLNLAKGGRQAYEAYLNWDAWGRSMCEVFHRTLANRRPGNSVPSPFFVNEKG